MLLSQGLHPDFDVVKHVDRADARLVLTHALLIDLQHYLALNIKVEMSETRPSVMEVSP